MQQEVQLKRVTRRLDNLMTIVALLMSLFLITPVYAEKSEVQTKESFKVINLPGLKAESTFKQYAGYLMVNKKFQDYLFFWLFESQSSPETDPLVIWLSGGPGCSSISSMFEENGPFKLEKKGKTIHLLQNPYSWNAKANIIYVDQPVGSGMSYSKTKTFTKNQYEGSKEFYQFLKQFFKVFPEYQKRPLFITGESYAGHMIPGIATYIYEQEGKPDSIQVNLKGIAIGNGWIDPIAQSKVFPELLYAAGVIDAKQRNDANRLFAMSLKNDGVPECEDFGKPSSGKEGYRFHNLPVQSPYKGLNLPPKLKNNPFAISLKSILDQYTGKFIGTAMTTKDFIEIVDIIGNGPEGLRDLLPQDLKVVILDKSYATMLFQFFLTRLVSYTEHNGNSVNNMDVLNYGPMTITGTPLEWPEGDDSFQEYMDMPEVRKALHAESFPDKNMQACSPLVLYTLKFLYDDFFKSSLYLYPDLLSKIPILFYNGQNDLICSPMGTREFLMQIAQDPLVFYFSGKAEYSNAPYVPWVVKEEKTDSQGNVVVQEKRYGYYKRAGDLHFLNVLDSSHMVPLSKPEAAQILINNFIHNGEIIAD